MKQHMGLSGLTTHVLIADTRNPKTATEDVESQVAGSRRAKRDKRHSRCDRAGGVRHSLPDRAALLASSEARRRLTALRGYKEGEMNTIDRLLADMRETDESILRWATSGWTIAQIYDRSRRRYTTELRHHGTYVVGIYHDRDADITTSIVRYSIERYCRRVAYITALRDFIRYGTRNPLLTDVYPWAWRIYHAYHSTSPSAHAVESSKGRVMKGLSPEYRTRILAALKDWR